MRKPFADAKPGAGITPEDRFFANRVDVERHLPSENWSVWHLRINAGVSTPGLFNDPTEDQKALIDAANLTYVIVGETLRVSNGEREVMTLDITPIINSMDSNQTIDIQIGNRFNEIILTVVGADYDGPVPRILTPADLNPENKPVCPQTQAQPGRRGVVYECQRPAGHKGRHQFITEQGHGYFDTSGSMFSYTVIFGLPGNCDYCGYLLPSDGSDAAQACSFCAHWLRLLKEHENNANQFIINGRHYLPGAGGFYGRKFKVLRNDGTRWTGELFTQGEIPGHLRPLLPDNAVFED